MPTGQGLGAATVSIKVDTAKLKKDLASAEKQVRAASKRLNKAMGDNDQGASKAGSKKASAFSKGFSRSLTNFVSQGGKGGVGSVGAEMGASLMGGMSLGITAGVAVVVAAVVGVAAAAFASLRAFIETEKKLLRISAVFRSTGFAAGKSSREIRQFAVEMSKISLAPEADILEAATLIATFQNIVGENFEKAIKVSEDLAITMGTNTKSAALQLAKALAQPLTGLQSLREVGILFTDEQKDMIVAMDRAGQTVEAQNAVFEILATNGIDGASEATDTLSGKTAVLSNAYDTLLTSTGELLASDGSLAEGLQVLINMLQTAADDARRYAREIELATTATIKLDAAQLKGTLTAKKRHEINLEYSMGLKLLEQEATKAHKESTNRDATIVQRAKSRSDALLGLVAKEQKAVIAKEKAIIAARFKRNQTAILSDKVNAELGIATTEKRIKAEQDLRKKATKEADQRKLVSDVTDGIKIRRLDDEKKKIEALIKAEKKREDAKASVGFGSAEGVFQDANKEQADRFNEELEAQKKLKIEKLEAQKELLEAQKKDIKLLGEIQRDFIDANLEKVIDASKKQEELLKSILKDNKAQAAINLQEAIEELDLSVMRDGIKKAFADAIIALKPLMEELRTVTSAPTKGKFETETQKRIRERGDVVRNVAGKNIQSIGASIEGTEESLKFGKRLERSGELGMQEAEKRRKVDDEKRNTLLKDQKALQEETNRKLTDLLIKSGGSGVFGL